MLFCIFYDIIQTLCVVASGLRDYELEKHDALQQELQQKICSKIQYVMVNVRAARRYGIYPRSFSIPDEGGARVWYVKTTEGMSCTRRDAVC